jgi:predicted O-methyltransferase YrrM
VARNQSLWQSLWIERLRAGRSKLRQEPHAAQRFLARRSFRWFERAGLHVTADHFYEPIPNLAMLGNEYAAGVRPCAGIDFRFAEAQRVLLDLLDRFGGEFFTSAQRLGFRERNLSYAGVDAALLYCFVRDRKPTRVLEIGQGVSTRIMLAALDDNARESGTTPSFVTIDPFDRLEDFSAGNDIRVDVDRMRTPLQAISPRLWEELGGRDFVFIDSSHVHKFGSDVELIFDRVLPSLAAGVAAHLHDIFSPYHYPRDWYVRDKRFWNEGYHLENFLRFNHAFRVLVPTHYLVRDSAELAAAWPTVSQLDGRDLEGSSFYLERIN